MLARPAILAHGILDPPVAVLLHPRLRLARVSLVPDTSLAIGVSTPDSRFKPMHHRPARLPQAAAGVALLPVATEGQALFSLRLAPEVLFAAPGPEAAADGIKETLAGAIPLLRQNKPLAALAARAMWSGIGALVGWALGNRAKRRLIILLSFLDAQQVISRGLTGPTCTAPGDWRCVADCRSRTPQSVLVHKLHDGSIQCASSTPNSCTMFPGLTCNGMTAPPQSWNANGRVCARYNQAGFCRDAMNLIAFNRPAPGCGRDTAPRRSPGARPAIRPSNNWAPVLGPYGTAPNNVDSRYSNFFHVIPDSLLPALQTWDGKSWVS